MDIKKIETILKESINKLCPVINKKDQKRISNYIKNIALYVDYIAGIEKKYKGAAKHTINTKGIITQPEDIEIYADIYMKMKILFNCIYQEEYSLKMQEKKMAIIT